MEQFSLEKYLENPNCKVVTRDGRKVRIICTDSPNVVVPIVGFVEGEICVRTWEVNGTSNNPNRAYDLFFANEGDGLTELQKTLEEDCDCYVNLYNDGKTREELREWIKCWCNRIIDLAREELEKSNPYSGNQNQEWSEEDERNWRHCLHYIDAYVTPVKEHVDWYKNIRNRIHSQPQQKQEWSEEDEKMLNSAISLVYEVGDISLHSWLKSIKDRVQPQPKQEWSEEDKSMYIRTLGILGKCYMGELPTKVEEELNWFKSIEFQSHWKPSEEQMKALCNVAFEFGNSCLSPYSDNDKDLVSLYNDLKKL